MWHTALQLQHAQLQNSGKVLVDQLSPCPYLRGWESETVAVQLGRCLESLACSAATEAYTVSAGAVPLLRVQLQAQPISPGFFVLALVWDQHTLLTSRS